MVTRSKEHGASKGKVKVGKLKVNDLVLLNPDSTMQRDASRLHHGVVINNFQATVPGCYFLYWPAQGHREFLVTSLESTVP